MTHKSKTTRTDPANPMPDQRKRHELAEAHALREEDARALKLTLAVLVGGPLKPGGDPAMDAIQEVETLNEPFTETLDKVSRIEIDGKRIVKVDRSDPECKGMIEFTPLLTNDDVSGGLEAVFLALCRQLHDLVGMPKHPEDPPDDRHDLQPAAIRRIAATIRMAPAEARVH